MPDATHTHGKRVTRITTPSHPLDPLTSAELDAGRAVLKRAGLLGDSIRFPSVLPVEPRKADMLEWKPGRAFDRSILYTLLDTATGASREVTVSVTEDAVTSDVPLATTDAPYGQPPYLFEEYERVDALVKQNPDWQQAMSRRGVTDKDAAFCAPLAPGYFGFDDEVGRRIIRSLTFLRADESDSPWSHPVEGLVVTIDLTSGEVVRVHDEGDVPIPDVDGNYDAARVGPARTTLKPIDITQPKGPSFTVEGSHVQWENWSFRVGFNAREGLVLNQVAFRDGDEDRSVLYRASVPEMVVPYGDTSPNRFWISYFDAGEYLLGKNANPLSLGCDCLGVIHYFDGVVADDNGHAQTIPQVICMHEEDYGVLWKHTDLDGNADVRRSRRLVVSYFSTVGNYDYGFFWYFYLDGTIQVEAKATGIVFNGAGTPGEHNPHALEIAPGLFAPVHQHLFCARLDVAIDGERNAIDEVDAVGMPTGEANPYGNAFTFTRTPLRSEKEAARLANPAAARSWHVRSTERTNHLGQPTAYHLLPQGQPTLLAQADATVSARAAFATKHLWASQYDDGQLWPGGAYPNQHAGDAGLPTYTAGDRSLEGEDVVLWHTFGPTHLPRPEDFPIMPVDYSGFLFKPFGFFDENPALDVPDTSAGSCDASESCGCSDGGSTECGCSH